MILWLPPTSSADFSKLVQNAATAKVSQSSLSLVEWRTMRMMMRMTTLWLRWSVSLPLLWCFLGTFSSVFVIVTCINPHKSVKNHDPRVQDLRRNALILPPSGRGTKRGGFSKSYRWMWCVVCDESCHEALQLHVSWIWSLEVKRSSSSQLGVEIKSRAGLLF